MLSSAILYLNISELKFFFCLFFLKKKEISFSGCFGQVVYDGGLSGLLGLRQQHHGGGGRVGGLDVPPPSLVGLSVAADTVQAVVHVVLEEPPARVAELVEEQHEEDRQAVADEQLHGQQRSAHVLVEVRLEEVPQRDERQVLGEAAAVVRRQPAPALLALDELAVRQVQLHRRPAEDVDAGVEQREHDQHHHRAQLGEVLLHVLRQRALLGPELGPGEEEEEEQVGHAHQDDPVLERRAEQDQGGDARGDLQAAPHDHAQVSFGPQPHLVVVVADLDGQGAAHQGAVYDGDQGDDHQSPCGTAACGTGSSHRQ